MKSNIFSSKNSMYDLLIKNVDNYKNSIAITSNTSKIKYESFINKIDEYAKSFNNLGLTEKDIVTIILPNIIDSLVCIYALNKLGIICNVIHYLSSEEEIRKSINETASHYIVTTLDKLDDIKSLCDEEYIYKIIYIYSNDILNPIDKIKNIFKKRINISSKYISFYRFRITGKTIRKNTKSTINSENIALIINHNSKKIYLTNNNINYYANHYIPNDIIKSDRYKVLTDESIINSIPIYHRTLLNRQNIVLNNLDSTKLVIDNIVRYNPNILEIRPNTLEKICSNRKVNKINLSFIKLIICSKGTLSEYMYNKIKTYLFNHGCDAKIITSYGMLETTSNFTYNNNLDSKVDSVGIPIKDMCVKIINTESNKECKINEIGQICIKGPLLDKNESGKWFNSGDIGYIDEEGHLYFKSSIKRIIVSNGINIYPEEIENIIKKHEYVKDVSIVGVPHPYKKEVVKVYIVLKDRYVLNSEIKKSIKEYCEKNIAKYALPYAYAYRKELPKTNIGKVAYQELINEKED